MGYCIFVLPTDFFIAKEHHSSVLEAIRLLNANFIYPDVTDAHFAFVEDSRYQQSASVEEALTIWRWLPELDEIGNIVSVEFLGEKLGDDDVLFKGVAPFVRSGGSIQVVGEDGRVWRWLFNNGDMQKEEGVITYQPTSET